jgi:hypothetical protein
MNVIVIGNGPSLLENNNGKLIDLFDCVVRFNNFKIKGYENHTGIKTTHWFNTIGNQKLEEGINPFNIVWHSWHWEKETDKNYQEFIKNYPRAKKTIRTEIEEIQKYMNDFKYFNYSTGAIAIWMLLKEFPNITITGFDWWKKKDKHHYHNNGTIGTIHKPEKELAFIKKLISENKVKFL